MKKNQTDKIGRNIKKLVRKTYLGMSLACIMLFSVNMPVYAGSTGASEVTAGLTNLKNLVLGVVTVIGVIVIIKNVMEFASAYQQQDTSGVNAALKGIVGGLMMAFIGSMLTLLGIS